MNTSPSARIATLERELRTVETEIKSLRERGAGDDEIAPLLAKREALTQEIAAAGVDETAPVRREPREDPVTGADLAEQSQEDAVVRSLSRFR